MVYSSALRRTSRRVGKRVNKYISKTKGGRKAVKKMAKFSKDKGVRKIAKVVKRNAYNNAYTKALMKSVVNPLYEGFVYAKPTGGASGEGALHIAHTATNLPIHIMDLTCVKNNGYSPHCIDYVNKSGGYNRVGGVPLLESLEGMSPNPIEPNFTLGKQFLEYVSVKLCLRGQAVQSQRFKIMLISPKKEYIMPFCHLTDAEDNALPAEVREERLSFWNDVVSQQSFNKVAKIPGNTKNVGRFLNILWSKDYVIKPPQDANDHPRFQYVNIFKKFNRNFNLTRALQYGTPNLSGATGAIGDVEAITANYRQYLCTPSNFRDRVYLVIVGQDNVDLTCSYDMSITKKLRHPSDLKLHQTGQSANHSSVAVPAAATYLTPAVPPASTALDDDETIAQ